MNKSNFRDKFRYWFDNLMSKGTMSLILLLAAITFVVIAIAGIITSFLNAGEYGNVLEGMWLSLMHAIDAGTIAGDDTTNIVFILVMIVVTLCGLFITSMLIGVISTGLEDKISTLRKGRSQVLEQNHVIILGFNENTINIIRELVIANENQKKAVVVVLDNQDKTEMEDLIHQRVPQTKATKVICRSGNIDNIADISICSPETCKSIIVNAKDDFMTIKAILASATILEESVNNNAFITALIHEEQNIQAAQIAGSGRAEIFYYQNSIARIMAHTCRQPGMSTVFTNLLSYTGDEIYVEQISDVVGKTMGNINLYFPKSTIIGLVRDNKPWLNPPASTEITKDDKLILIAQDDNVSHPKSNPAKINKDLIVEQKESKDVLQNTLILGCNELMEQVIEELDSYVAKGSTVTIASEKICDEYLPKQENLKNININTKICNIFDRVELESIINSELDNILILSNSDEDDNQADSKTLLLLLQIRDIAKNKKTSFTVTSEMRNIENQELAQVTKVTDFIISSNITALMMTQISQTREQFNILDDLLSDAGSELYMKEISRYVKTDVAVDFYTVGSAASAYGEIAIGLKKVLSDGSFEIILNPNKETPIVFSKEDSLILLAED